MIHKQVATEPEWATKSPQCGRGTKDTDTFTMVNDDVDCPACKILLARPTEAAPQ
jgi:hypothetical protein